MFDIDELIKAGLTGWPLAFTLVFGTLFGVSILAVFFTGSWPWEGIIHKTYVCKCKKNCPCKESDEEDDEDE